MKINKPESSLRDLVLKKIKEKIKKEYVDAGDFDGYPEIIKELEGLKDFRELESFYWNRIGTSPVKFYEEIVYWLDEL